MVPSKKKKIVLSASIALPGLWCEDHILCEDLGSPSEPWSDGEGEQLAPSHKSRIVLPSGSSKWARSLLSLGIVPEEERAFVGFCFVLGTVSRFFLPSFWGANLSEGNHRVHAEVMQKAGKESMCAQTQFVIIRGCFVSVCSPSHPTPPGTQTEASHFTLFV